MYAITGITGRVGGIAARALLDAGERVRAVVRGADKGAPWAAQGCEVALATASDAGALKHAFRGAEGVFLMTAPVFDPEPGFPLMRAIAAATVAAIEEARPGRVVFLSTVGAQATEPNLLSGATMMEQALRSVSVPVAFLRPAWFMENAEWDVEAAKGGVVPSFLQPLDHAIAMVATPDIGAVAAQLLRDRWSGVRIVELEGPRRYSANDVAAAFANVLGHPVRMEAVERERWESLFRAQGMQNPTPRMRMLDGFNEGWIDFQDKRTVRKTTTPLETVLAQLVARSGALQLARTGRSDSLI